MEFINKKSVKKPFKYALSNMLYIGKVPHELKNLTCVEESLIARCRVKCSIYKIHSKQDKTTSQYKISGNIITYPQNPNNIIKLLPSLPEREYFHVIFVGAIQPCESKLKQVLKVRREKIRNALIWLKNNNCAYSDVEISNDNLDKLPLDDIPNVIKDNITHINYDAAQLDTTAYDNIDRNDINLNDDELSLNTSGLVNSVETLSMDISDQIKLLEKTRREAKKKKNQ